MNPDLLQLDILPERPVVRDDEISELDLVLEIRSAKNSEELQERTRLNLCIVMDRSGSMEGEKLDTAKKSCTEILNRLNPGDLFTVVVFDDEAEVVANPQVPLAEVVEKIEAINSGGVTNLSSGWYLGLLELQTHMTSSHYSRLFLLSDGQANRGETKRSTLAQEASKSRELGITTSTIGIGDDFQEDILEAIASESGGRFWYIQESRIEDILMEEFTGSMSIVMDRPRLELVLPSGVRISRELNDLKKTSGKYRFRPIKGADIFNFAVRLEVNPNSISGEAVAVSARLYDGDTLLREASKTLSVRPHREVVLSKVNPVVTSVVQQYELTVTNEEVMERMARGDIGRLKKMLALDVGHCRAICDALEFQGENERARIEFEYFTRETLEKEVHLALSEMLQGFGDAPEVQSFTKRWRKIGMQSQQRLRGRRNGMIWCDDDLLDDLLENALDLVDVLTDKFPDRREQLEMNRESLRGFLARHN